ncbi:hypothetical protein BH11PSE2_BH11PSE2_17350 [soil metagenome]
MDALARGVAVQDAAAAAGLRDADVAMRTRKGVCVLDSRAEA